MIVFSNKYPRTEALKRNQWRVFEIIEENLATKPLWPLNTDCVIKAHNHYTANDDWRYEIWLRDKFKWCEKCLEWLRNGQLCLVILGINTELLARLESLFANGKIEMTTITLAYMFLLILSMPLMLCNSMEIEWALEWGPIFNTGSSSSSSSSSTKFIVTYEIHSIDK